MTKIPFCAEVPTKLFVTVVLEEPLNTIPLPLIGPGVIVSQSNPTLFVLIILPLLLETIPLFGVLIIDKPLIVQLGADEVITKPPPLKTTLGPKVLLTPLAVVVLTTVPSIIVLGARIGGRSPVKAINQYIWPLACGPQKERVSDSTFTLVGPEVLDKVWKPAP